MAKPARKRAKSSSAPKAPSRISVKGSLRPSARQQAKARQCLERSGKILIGFRDVSVTRLPRSITPALVFKD